MSTYWIWAQPSPPNLMHFPAAPGQEGAQAVVVPSDPAAPLPQATSTSPSAEDPQKSAQADDYPSGPVIPLQSQSSLPACIKIYSIQIWFLSASSFHARAASTPCALQEARARWPFIKREWQRLALPFARPHSQFNSSLGVASWALLQKNHKMQNHFTTCLFIQQTLWFGIQHSSCCSESLIWKKNSTLFLRVVKMSQVIICPVQTWQNNDKRADRPSS